MGREKDGLLSRSALDEGSGDALSDIIPGERWEDTPPVWFFWFILLGWSSLNGGHAIRQPSGCKSLKSSWK